MNNRFQTISMLMSIAAISAAMLLSCSSEKDAYLRSLKLDVEYLTATDSINIDQYNLFQVGNVVKIEDDWLLMSAIDSDYRLLFLNMKTSEHFFAVKKGRGPGEMIGGSSLHMNGDNAIFYDSYKSICLRIDGKRTVESRALVADTIAVFNQGVSKPIYMTSCGDAGFISGNYAHENIWYSYYDNAGRVYSSVESVNFEELSNDRDAKISFWLSCKYVSNKCGSKVCVASVGSPSLSFAGVSAGNLVEYKRYVAPPSGMVAGHITPEHTTAFSGIAADDEYVYLLYSGHRFLNDKYPADECNHMIVYDWNGIPVRHYLLNRNVSSICIDGNNMWAGSTYPESCVYRFVMNDL